MAQDKSELFIALVKLGAGRRMNVDKAMTYTKKHADTLGMQSAINMLAQPTFNSEFYFACAMDVMTSAVKGGEYTHRVTGIKTGRVYLRKDVAEQIFDDEGKVRSEITAGRRNVAQAEFKGFSIHVKQDPEVHANQFIAGELRRNFGSYDITPYGEPFLATDRERNKILMLFIVTAPGEKYKKTAEALGKKSRRLSSREATEVLLTDGMIIPEDFNPNNANIDDKKRLIIFDEDHCLIGDRSKEKSIMYCQKDLLDTPLDPSAVTQFCMRDFAAEMGFLSAAITERSELCDALFKPKVIRHIGKNTIKIGKSSKRSVRDMVRDSKIFVQNIVGIEGKPLLGFF